MTQSNPKDVVDRYNQALGAKDFGAARALLADDLHFEGPIDRFDMADDYVAAITQLYGMVKGVEHQATVARGLLCPGHARRAGSRRRVVSRARRPHHGAARLL